MSVGWHVCTYVRGVYSQCNVCCRRHETHMPSRAGGTPPFRMTKERSKEDTTHRERERHTHTHTHTHTKRERERERRTQRAHAEKTRTHRLRHPTGIAVSFLHHHPRSCCKILQMVVSPVVQKVNQYASSHRRICVMAPHRNRKEDSLKSITTQK